MKKKIVIPVENEQQVETIKHLVKKNGGLWDDAENGTAIIVVIDEEGDALAYSELEWEISKEDYEDFVTVSNVDTFIRTEGREV